MKRCMGEVVGAGEQPAVRDEERNPKRRRIGRSVLDSTPKTQQTAKPLHDSTADFPFSLFLPVSPSSPTDATASPFPPTTLTDVNTTSLNEFLYSTLQQELNVIHERLDAQVQQGLQENTSHRAKCFFIFELAKRYREENEHIYTKYIRENLLQKLSNYQAQRCTAEAIQQNALEEKQDLKLQYANHLIMKATRRRSSTKETKDALLQEASELLLDLLPQPIGRVVDLYNNSEPSTSPLSPSTSSLSEKQSMYVDVDSYMDFEMIQQLHPDRDVRLLPVSHHYAFHLYVFLLIEQRRFERASEVCTAALRRNPLFVHCKFEQAEIHKMQHNAQALFTLTTECLRICYKQRDLAKCYRNFGFYFVETQQYEYAVAAFLKSLTYEIHPMVKGELLFITNKLAGTKDPMLRSVCSLLTSVEALEKRHNQLLCTSTIPALKLGSDAEHHVHHLLSKAQIPSYPSPTPSPLAKCNVHS